MSLKSRSEIYDRLERLLYAFAAQQDDTPTGLNGKESLEAIAERFIVWLGDDGMKICQQDVPRKGKVFLK